MPRYHFHILDEEGFIPDEEGEVLPDLEAARREARRSVKDLISECLKGGDEVDGREVEIADESGAVLSVSSSATC